MLRLEWITGSWGDRRISTGLLLWRINTWLLGWVGARCMRWVATRCLGWVRGRLRGLDRLRREASGMVHVRLCFGVAPPGMAAVVSGLGRT